MAVVIGATGTLAEGVKHAPPSATVVDGHVPERGRAPHVKGTVGGACAVVVKAGKAPTAAPCSATGSRAARPRTAVEHRQTGHHTGGNDVRKDAAGRWGRETDLAPWGAQAWEGGRPLCVAPPPPPSGPGPMCNRGRQRWALRPAASTGTAHTMWRAAWAQGGGRGRGAGGVQGVVWGFPLHLPPRSSPICSPVLPFPRGAPNCTAAQACTTHTK